MINLSYEPSRVENSSPMHADNFFPQKGANLKLQIVHCAKITGLRWTKTHPHSLRRRHSLGALPHQRDRESIFAENEDHGHETDLFREFFVQIRFELINNWLTLITIQKK